jgi:hypothetical protein
LRDFKQKFVLSITKISMYFFIKRIPSIGFIPFYGF